MKILIVGVIGGLAGSIVGFSVSDWQWWAIDLSIVILGLHNWKN